MNTIATSITAMCITLITLLSGFSIAQQNQFPATYTGVLPCADCEGISYRLTLNTDGHYSEVIIYKGKNQMPATAAGKYYFKNNSVTLEKETKGMQFFKMVPMGLIMLDSNGLEYTGENSGMYFLKNTSDTSSGANQVKDNATGRIKLSRLKYKSGIDFYATGNEPSWSIDCDFQKRTTFKFADGKALELPAVKGERAMDANVVMYRYESEGNVVTLQIMQQECMDGLSGEKTRYAAMVEVQLSGEQQPKSLTGCGTYTPDYRLTGKWNLNTIGKDEKVNVKQYKDGLPYLMFNVDEMRFSGFAGCNSINGSLFAEIDKIRLMQIVSSLKACNDEGREAKLLKTLQSCISYKIAGNNLTLSGPGDIRLTFIKDERDVGVQTEATPSYTVKDLNASWILESMEGVIVEPDAYNKNRPALELNTAEMFYQGSTGCNNIRGQFEATASAIKILPGAMTRMHCEKSNESEYLELLHKVDGYKIESGKLILLKQQQPVMIFKKGK